MGFIDSHRRPSSRKPTQSCVSARWADRSAGFDYLPEFVVAVGLIVSLVDRWPAFVVVELPFFGWVVVVLARALAAVRRAGTVDLAAAVASGADEPALGDASTPDEPAPLLAVAGVDMTSPVRVTTTI